MKYNMFIYYGVEVNKNDFENLNLLGIDNIYELAFSHGLRFREIGDVSSSWHYIIGEEILWVNDLQSNLDINSLKLAKEKETEIKKKLLDIGIKGKPTYKIFMCWN